MDAQLTGRIAVITGGSPGIGKATALRFANAGARIVIADLKSSGVEDEIRGTHGEDRATFVACNVTDEAQIEDLFKQAARWGDGRVDISCHYAGVTTEVGTSFAHRTHDLPTELFDRTMLVNARGVFLCCRYAIQQMLVQDPLAPNARGECTRGWIVNAASTVGTVAHPNALAYTTSKFAVVGMTKQMAIDYAKDRIHVNAVCPGFVDTPMIGPCVQEQEGRDALAAKHPWNALGRPEDIADAALFLCSDGAMWITGHTMMIDGAYTCW
ncbi:NAD(P)-binding protein [Polychaeton citri CBS 116435]|uniref:NAD(P)-binding protein n=1 Tax=Polychaeton citri CBS 116435 TaxID=1314669 RepID=A0A9P4Q283_9PEZI|nr:NAD(P)-binding protein [Polychaeton citri CBS 116435]